ncbi:MAG: hypothetical protein MHM6MM_000233 [Cercozoa sp. M6MM]
MLVSPRDPMRRHAHRRAADAHELSLSYNVPSAVFRAGDYIRVVPRLSSDHRVYVDRFVLDEAPPLCPGIVFDPSTGVFQGTGTQRCARRVHHITAIAQGMASHVFLTFEIMD